MMLDLIKKMMSELSNEESIELFSISRKNLKNRGITRSYNDVGDIGEHRVFEFYKNSPSLPNLQAVKVGTKCVDAITENNNRYSIKATISKVTGVFNGLNNKDSELLQEQLFEYVIIVILDEYLSAKAIYELDWDSFLSLKKWNKSKKTWFLSVTKELKRKAKILYDVDTAV